MTVEQVKQDRIRTVFDMPHVLGMVDMVRLGEPVAVTDGVTRHLAAELETAAALLRATLPEWPHMPGWDVE